MGFLVAQDQPEHMRPPNLRAVWHALLEEVAREKVGKWNRSGKWWENHGKTMGKPWKTMGKPWENHGNMLIYMENGSFIVDLLNMVIFHSFLYVYQRVSPCWIWDFEEFCGDVGCLFNGIFHGI
jgi:hypothetical protein